jgi:hypothetical protein
MLMIDMGNSLILTGKLLMGNPIVKNNYDLLCEEYEAECFCVHRLVVACVYIIGKNCVGINHPINRVYTLLLDQLVTSMVLHLFACCAVAFPSNPN